MSYLHFKDEILYFPNNHGHDKIVDREGFGILPEIKLKKEDSKQQDFVLVCCVTVALPEYLDSYRTDYQRTESATRSE